MRGIAASLLGGCLLAAACSAPTDRVSYDPGRYMESIEDRYIVLLQHQADPHDVAARHGIEPFLVYEPTPYYCGFAAQLDDELVEELYADQDVRTIEPDRIVVAHVDTTNGVSRMEANLNRVWINGDVEEVNVDVAILDTGIDDTHPDLNVVGGDLFVSMPGPPGSYDDGHGHGTHVAGTVAGRANGAGIIGVAPGARLWAGKVLDDSGGGTTATAAAGVDWAVGLGIPVINMSLGLLQVDEVTGELIPYTDTCETTSDILHLAICNAWMTNQVTIVTSAGNSGVDANAALPASFDEVITVSALADFDGLPGGLVANDDPSIGVEVWDAGWSAPCNHAEPGAYPEQQDDTLAEFSNFGPDVDIIAPGFCIVSSWPRNRYAYSSGTSMAAPHVAGAVAVYLHNHPNAPADEVRRALLERANPFPCDGAGGVCDNDGDSIQEPLAFLGHLDDSFESDSVGAVPAYMSASSGTGGAAVTDTIVDSTDGGTRSVVLDTPSISGDPDYARLDFCLPDTADTHFHASFSVNFQALVDWNPIAIVDDGDPATMLYWWWVDAAGLATDDQLVGTFGLGSWHRVTIDIDRDAGTASFDVDGNGVTSTLATWDPTSAPMKCVAFSTWPDQLQSVVLDDLLVTSFDY